MKKTVAPFLICMLLMASCKKEIPQPQQPIIPPTVYTVIDNETGLPIEHAKLTLYYQYGCWACDPSDTSAYFLYSNAEGKIILETGALLQSFFVSKSGYFTNDYPPFDNSNKTIRLQKPVDLTIKIKRTTANTGVDLWCLSDSYGIMKLISSDDTIVSALGDPRIGFVNYTGRPSDHCYSLYFTTHGGESDTLQIFY